jgi:hypothetical protein
MLIPLAYEIAQNLKNLSIPSVHTALTTKIYQCSGCAACRKELLETEATPGQITTGTFWLVSAKYRLDILAMDIPQVADHLSLSIALAQTYLPYLASYKSPPYEPTVADEMFWYSIEHGFRLASSGWDRIALLLDLVLKLGVGQHCNFRKVYRELEGKGLQGVAAFQQLKSFRDGPFLELEELQGEGIRHETTHLMSIRTRFLMEVLEQFGPQKSDSRMTPESMCGLLAAHYEHFIAGIDNALELIDFYWAAEQSKGIKVHSR